MKNIFNKFAFFIALSFVFISCGNLTTSENDDSIPQGKGKITISTDLQNGRSVLPTAIDETTTGLKWELVGTKDDTQQIIESWTDGTDEAGTVTVTAYQSMTDSEIFIDTGTWDFTLTASNTDGENVLSATISTTINAGENKLNFVMQEATENAASGSIEFTLNFPKDVVGNVEAKLFKYENNDTEISKQTLSIDSSSTDNYSSVKYSYPDATGTTSSPLSAGYYILKIELQQNVNNQNMPINTYSCLIRVAPGLLSQGKYTLPDLAQLYTINYKLEGGKFIDSATTTSYNAYTSFALPEPTKEGYDFAGWYTQDYTDAGSITENLFGNAGETQTINADTTLYAKWTPNTYTITFDANGGSGEMDSQSFTYDAAQNLTANKFTRSGYTFAGWNTSSEGTGTSYANSASIKNLTDEPNGNITLYAQWAKAVIILTQDELNTYSSPNNNYRYTLPSGEYCVTEDLSIQYPIVINGEVNLYSNTEHTISLANGYSSDASSSWLSMIVISTANDTLTLGGGTGNLTIDGTNNLPSTLNYLVMSSGTFNLSDKVTITNGNVNYGAVYIGGGTFTMTGGSIEYNNSKTEGYGAGIHVQGNPNTTTVNISGGSVYNNYYSTNTNQFASICNKGGNVTILGETLDNEKFTQNIINGNITDEIPVRSWEELVTNIDSIPSSKTDTTKFLVTNDLDVTETCYNYSPVTITPVGNVKITTTNDTIFSPNANLTITGDTNNTLTLQGNTSTNIGLIDSDFSNEINIALQFCNISNGYILVEQLENWTMTNCTIKNSSYDYGAFSLNTSGNVTINDCSFESNTYDVYVKNSPILTLNGTLKLPKIYYDNSLNGRDLGIVIGENLQLKDETKISIEIYSTDKTKYDIDLFNLADGQTVPEEIFTLVNESYQINSSTGEIEEIGGGNEPLAGTEVETFDALKAAINGTAEVIIITKNITITEYLDITRDVTIAANSDVTVTDDSEDPEDPGYSYYAFYVEAGGKLTLGGGSGVLTFKQVTDKNYATIGTVTSKATVEININNNVKFTENPYYCISFGAGTGAVLNINGGEFVNNSYTPIQINNLNAVCNITGGTIANNSSSANNCAGIYVKSGNLTIKGGNITDNTYTSNSSLSGSSIRVPSTSNGSVIVNGETLTANTTYTKNIIDGIPQE